MANVAIVNPAYSSQNQTAEVEVSVVMPCLNEAQTVGTCIAKAQQSFREGGIAGEVIVADHGSTDGSQEIASRLGARVIPAKERGYGSALMGGIAGADGKYVLMGNRFRGGILPGAMPPLHKYLGDPVLTRIGRLFFGGSSGDFYCGLRGFSKQAYE